MARRRGTSVASVWLVAVVTIVVAVATRADGGERAPATKMRGVFALDGRASPATATMTIRPRDATSADIDIREIADGRTITDYETDMEKKVHLIVISDDFAYFEHAHPDVPADGHMTMDLHVPAPGHYHLYADTQPHGLDHQVFRFDTVFGTAAARAPALNQKKRVVRVDRYTVTLASIDLATKRETTLALHIAEAGHPAVDLHPYLGGAAHAVFVSQRDLTYVHVHPMACGTKATDDAQMPGMAMGARDEMEMPDLLPDAHVDADMSLRVTLPTPGPYRLWLQFRGGHALHVASFVVNAT